MDLRAIEMCAGAGGQALGLHHSGFTHEALIEIDKDACETLRYNNRELKLGWKEIVHGDLKRFNELDAIQFRGVIDLVAGGVPCPPFSKAGKQLGAGDERDLFPTALSIIEKVMPLAVMLENVPGLYEKKFSAYREKIASTLDSMGYDSEWRLLQANEFGVPQLRPRVLLVGIKKGHFHHFAWPEGDKDKQVTVGEALYDLMASNGWEGAEDWRRKANKIAPTLVGGSKKHGGPDLGPTRAKRQWKSLAINGHRLGSKDEIPGPGFKGVLLRNGGIREGYENMPLLNLKMAARIQGFPDYWTFTGNKTNAYRQIGNAFPPPVAEAVGQALFKAVKLIKQGVPEHEIHYPQSTPRISSRFSEAQYIEFQSLQKVGAGQNCK